MNKISEQKLELLQLIQRARDLKKESIEKLPPAYRKQIARVRNDIETE